MLASSGVTTIVARGLIPACAVADQPRQVAPEMHEAVTVVGEQYYQSTFDCSWVAGPVVFAADAAGQVALTMDGAASLEIVRPDGTTASWAVDFSNQCTTVSDSQPLDVSVYFQPGANRVTVRLNDVCGLAEDNAQLYFSTT